MNSNENNKILHNNMEYLSSYYPKYVERLKDGNYEKEENISVDIESSYTGIPILTIKKNGKKNYLAGKYAPEAPLLDWLCGQDRIYHESIFMIVGMGNWLQIKEFFERLDKKVKAIIYEPSLTIFERVIQTYDITELMKNEEIGLVVGKNSAQYMSAFFSGYIHRENMSLTKVYISGNYMKIFPEEVKKSVQDLKQYFVDTIINWNTKVRYTDVVGKNVFNNILYYYHGYNVMQFKNVLPENVPVVVVSAGPSLDKNINELKMAVGKCCIIATDTAIKPLLNRGIYPHFVAIVDGKKPSLLFEHSEFSKIPLLTCTVVAKDVMNLHQGKKIFYMDGNSYEQSVIEEINEHRDEKLIIPYLSSGGSVANTAFSFAYHLGAKNIILIGQDLALTNNKTHADGTFKERMDDIDIDKKRYIEVEDIYGGKVYTRGDFDRYRKWFENNIQALKEIGSDVNVIDATEGGAKIHGTEIMTLKEAIAQCCIVEWSEKVVFESIGEMLSDKDKEVLLSFFANTLDKLEEVRKQTEKGIKYYDRMIKLAKKKTLNAKEYLKIYSKVKKINDFMENDSVARFVMDNLEEMQNAMLSTMYLSKEDEQDERIILAQKGKVILETVLPMIDTLTNIANETVMQYNGDDTILYERYLQGD